LPQFALSTAHLAPSYTVAHWMWLLTMQPESTDTQGLASVVGDLPAREAVGRGSGGQQQGTPRRMASRRACAL